VVAIDLDDLAVRDAVAADPAWFVSGTAPVCIDEYQHVPPVLDAIKAELNRRQAPGRFVIAGSTRHDALPRAAQALTGRLHPVDVAPLSQGEIGRVREDFVEQAMVDPAGLVSVAASTTTREEYIDRVVAGGFDAVSEAGHWRIAGLRKLREAIGSRFVGGVALYTGPRSYTFEDWIHVVPIDRLWTPVGQR
jgi:hypothetical protein